MDEERKAREWAEWEEAVRQDELSPARQGVYLFSRPQLIARSKKELGGTPAVFDWWTGVGIGKVPIIGIDGGEVGWMDFSCYKRSIGHRKTDDFVAAPFEVLKTAYPIRHLKTPNEPKNDPFIMMPRHTVKDGVGIVDAVVIHKRPT